MDYHEQAFDEQPEPSWTTTRTSTTSSSSRHYHAAPSSTTFPSSSSISISISISWTERLASWLDLLTGPNFGILVAVLVVMIMQYKGSLMLFINKFSNINNLYDIWQQDGWQGIVDVLYRQKETMRAYYQMACELIRSCWRQQQQQQEPQRTGGTRLSLSLSLLRTTTSSSSSAVPPPLVLPEEEEEEQQEQVPSATINGKHHHHHHRKDRKNHRLSSATTTNNNNNSNGNHNQMQMQMQMQNSSSSLLPELDPSFPLKNGVVCRQQPMNGQPQYPQQQYPQQQQPEIEPAFLNEQDYPPGWLVYHPHLGVVSKEQADHYDKQSLPRLPSSSMMIAATISSG